MNEPVVAIVGRPNVGKSTLFNRITGHRKAIVESEPGVTRDRIYADSSWRETRFRLVDTGGVTPGTSDELLNAIREQVERAVDEAAVILFVVDARDGLTPIDEELAGWLRQTNKPVVLVANKVDTRQLEAASWEFYSLGLGDPVPISAEGGRNIGDLLDEVVKTLPQQNHGASQAAAIRVAIVGRPNAGKSSLLNKLLGEERAVVSDAPGTTRDAIDTYYQVEDREYLLIDTAGIRKRSRVQADLERFSVARALDAIERSDVVLLVIDATVGVSEQDQRIAGYTEEQGRAAVIVVNKWDLVEKTTSTMAEYQRRIRDELHFWRYAPQVYVSARTGQRVDKLLDQVDYVYSQGLIRVPTGRLNELIAETVIRHQPPSHKGRRLKIRYCTQAGVHPPTFVFFVNDPNLVHFAYERYLENVLRENYGFEGNPLVLKFRSSRRPDWGASGGNRTRSKGMKDRVGR